MILPPKFYRRQVPKNTGDDITALGFLLRLGGFFLLLISVCFVAGELVKFII